MSRPRVEINLKRCERLKELIRETGIKQNQLAADTKISQQAISAMVQGKANVTETTAQLISEKFPQYSVEWLMGFSDYKNNAEQFCDTISRAQEKADLLLRGLSTFAQLTDYQIKLPLPPSVGGRVFVEDAITAIKEGYAISHGDESIQMSLEEMNTFENEILDLVELHLKHLFRRKGAKNNG